MHDVFVDVGSGAGGEECNEPNQEDTINHGKKLDQNSSMPHFSQNRPKCLMLK